MRHRRRTSVDREPGQHVEAAGAGRRAAQPVPDGDDTFDVLEADRARRTSSWWLGDSIGQVEFDGPWPTGYSPPKIIKAPPLVSSQ